MPRRTGTFLALLLLAACGGVESRAATVVPPTVELPLLLPQGAETVLVVRPQQLWESPGLRHVVDALVTPRQLSDFAQRTGIDPLKVQELVVADYPDGQLFLLRSPADARRVVLKNSERMNTVLVSADSPFLRREGHIGTEPTSLAALDARTLVVGKGDLTMELAALFARVRDGRWPEGEAGALTSQPARALFSEQQDDVIFLLAPGHLSLPSGYGVSLLLAGQRALCATVIPQDPEHLKFSVVLVGEFPQSSHQNFRNLVESVALSDLGGALGLVEGLDTLSIQADEREVRISITLPVAPLASGLRLLLLAELSEILSGQAAQQTEMIDEKSGAGFDLTPRDQ